jgi:alpha-D-ribose 1-methylphosphonate 5-triphosphate synthase subunit PhnL
MISARVPAAGTPRSKRPAAHASGSGDEPTASLDAANRAVVVDLIDKKKRAGVAILAIVHDDEIRHAIADRIVDVTLFAAAA